MTVRNQIVAWCQPKLQVPKSRKKKVSMHYTDLLSVCPTDSYPRQDLPSPAQDQLSWPSFLQPLYRAHFLADLPWRQEDPARSLPSTWGSLFLCISGGSSCLAINPSKMELLSLPRSLSSLLSSSVTVPAHPLLCRRTAPAVFHVGSRHAWSPWLIDGLFVYTLRDALLDRDRRHWRICMITGASITLPTNINGGISTVFDAVRI